MSTKATHQPDTESALSVASMFAVGLGVISFALFPFLIPGLAILALFAVPLLPLAVVPVVAAAVFFATRGVARRLSLRSRSGRARAAAWGPQAGRSR